MVLSSSGEVLGFLIARSFVWIALSLGREEGRGCG